MKGNGDRNTNGNEPTIPSFGMAPPWREAGLGFTSSLPRGEGRVQRELGLEWGKSVGGRSNDGRVGGGILITSVSLGLGYTLHVCSSLTL